MKKLLVCLCMMMLGAVIGLMVGRMMPIELPEQDEVVRVDTLVRVDTVRMRVPVTKDSVVLRYVTRYLPVAKTKEPWPCTAMDGVEQPCTAANDQERPSMATDDVACEDEEETDEDGDGVPDGVPVSVPISQRVYEEAEYTAWVSGYEARLDSLELRRECLMVEREVHVMPKRRKWGCVVGAGPGYDLTKGTVGLSVGVTVGYTLF